mmetsp:Transcript_29250/g.71197  ORF Transcript_29250/g.71197 Transcript_29250/m.71197 type:complete len:316 (-) Transcript_29250:365-1312(-)
MEATPLLMTPESHMLRLHDGVTPLGWGASVDVAAKDVVDDPAAGPPHGREGIRARFNQLFTPTTPVHSAPSPFSSPSHFLAPPDHRPHDGTPTDTSVLTPNTTPPVRETQFCFPTPSPPITSMPPGFPSHHHPHGARTPAAYPPVYFVPQPAYPRPAAETAPGGPRATTAAAAAAAAAAAQMVGTPSFLRAGPMEQIRPPEGLLAQYPPVRSFVHLPRKAKAEEAEAEQREREGSTVTEEEAPIDPSDKEGLERQLRKKKREAAIARYRQKRKDRALGKGGVRYDCRKRLADSRPRIKGRFAKADPDEESASAQK